METLTADPLQAALRDGGRCPLDRLDSLETIFARLGSEPAALADALQKLGVLTRYQYRKIQLGRYSELLFGQYLILEKIGEGGMGKVYRGVDTRMARLVALKVVRPQLMSNKTVLRRYEREAEAAAKLDHPNIVKLFDAGEAAGRFYLAMEYVDGSDLSRLVKENGPLSTAEACEYVRMVALGLQHAHESGFVHRDIKPSNLLVYGERAIPGTGGRASLKILDMGLVRVLADSDSPEQSELTRDGTVVGTPDYMSPEQAKNSSSVDARADLYSLGCTLYYLLRGAVPFPDGTPIDKLIRHQLDPVPDVRQGRSDIPHMVGDIITRLLRKKPDERYQTAAEVAGLLALFTPDATAMDLSAPMPSSNTPRYANVDLAPLAAVPSLLSPVAAIRPPPPVTPTRSASPTWTTPAPPAARVVTVVRMAIPKPIVEPVSAESLPAAPESKKAEPKPRPRPKAQKPKKPEPNFPVLAVVAVALFAILLLGLGIYAFTRPVGNPVPTVPATEPKKTTPTNPDVPPPKNSFRPVDTLLPNKTQAVLLLHAKPYWDKIAGEWKPGTRQARMLDFLNLRYHFEPGKFDRALIAFQADPTEVLAVGEGAWLTLEWISGLDKAKRMKVDPADNRGTQLVKFFEPGPNGREVSSVRGVLFKGQAYGIGDRGAIDALVRAKPSDEPTIDPLLLSAVREASKGNALVSFFAASGWILPHKSGSRVETLGTHGVDFAAVTGRLERDFYFDVALTGRDDKMLKDFLAVELPKVFDTRGEKLKPLADAIRAASDEAKTELDAQLGYRIKATIVWKWEDALAAAEALIPTPPSFDKKD